MDFGRIASHEFVPTVNFRDGCQLGLSARAVLTTEPFSEAAHQRAVGERRTVGAERNHGGAVASARRYGEARSIETGKGDDVDAGLPCRLGERAVGNDQRRPRQDEDPFASRFAATCAADRFAVGDGGNAVAPAEPARGSAVGAKRPDVVLVIDFGAAFQREAREERMHGQQRRR